MIFNQGQFLGAEYTDDQLRAIAASKAAAATVGVHAAEAAGARAQTQAAFDEAVASYIPAAPASSAPAPRSSSKGLLWAGGLGAGALILFLSLRRPRRTKMHTRARAKKS